ncbi:MAG: hypothetical protein GF398_22050 [Chitinivibrionales bacterium]|nr:hypothetical protein [Chitinivibrionales bacterium]
MTASSAAKLPPRISLLMGDDALSRTKAVERLVDTLSAAFPDATEDSFDGSRDTLPEYAARLMTPSLFQETRICLVRRVHTCAADDYKELSALLACDMPDVYLIMEAAVNPSEVKARGKTAAFGAWLKAYTKLQKTSPERYAFETHTKPRDYELPKWLTQTVPRLFNRTISLPDAEYLVDLVGYDPGLLHTELQKIDIHQPEDEPVSRTAIDHVVKAGRESSPRELAQALGMKNMVKALEIVDNLFAAAFYPPASIAAIYRHFWHLFRIRQYAVSNPDTMRTFFSNRSREVQNRIACEIGIAAGLMQPGQERRVYPVIIKPQLIAQAKSFKDKHIKTIFRLLEDYDVGIKKGIRTLTRQRFELLCFAIVRVKELEDTVLAA